MGLRRQQHGQARFGQPLQLGLGVGLKRRNFMRSDIQALRTAYHQIFLGPGSFTERVDAVAAAWDVFAARHEEVERLSEMNSGTVAFELVVKATKIGDAAREALKALLDKMGTAALASGDPKDFQAVLTVKEVEVNALQVQRAIRNVIIAMANPAMQQDYDKQLEARVSVLQRQMDQAASVVPAGSVSSRLSVRAVDGPSFVTVTVNTA